MGESQGSQPWDGFQPAQPTAPVHPEQTPALTEVDKQLLRPKSLMETLDDMKDKFKWRMTELTDVEIPAEDKSLEYALQLAMDVPEFVGNPFLVMITHGNLISEAAEARTMRCFDAFHACQLMMMDSLIVAAKEAACQDADLLEASATETKHVLSQTELATIQIAQVSSEVRKLSEQLADLRAAVEHTRSKLEECSLRLSLIPPGYFELGGVPCGTSQSSKSPIAAQAYSIKERIREAQRLAWKLRGSPARPPPNSAASESAHSGGSVSSSFSRLPART